MAELEGSETASTKAACVAAAEGSGPNEEQLGLVAKRKLSLLFGNILALRPTKAASQDHMTTLSAVCVTWKCQLSVPLRLF